MRARYADILRPHLQGFLLDHLPIPAPPTVEEISAELKGLEKLSAALKGKGVPASSILRRSPMFDSVEIISHEHRCIICGESFACDQEECGIEGKYAVCLKPACIAEWEKEPEL